METILNSRKIGKYKIEFVKIIDYGIREYTVVIHINESIFTFEAGKNEYHAQRVFDNFVSLFEVIANEIQ